MGEWEAAGGHVAQGWGVVGLTHREAPNVLELLNRTKAIWDFQNLGALWGGVYKVEPNLALFESPCGRNLPGEISLWELPPHTPINTVGAHCF